MATNNSTNGTSLVTIFTSSGTWNKNPATTCAILIAWGSGGGGGSGRQGTDTSSSGGGGASSCSFIYTFIDASYLASSEVVTIGGTANGAIGQTSIDTNGILGTQPNTTSFGSSITRTVGTNAGGAGSTTSGPAGTGPVGENIYAKVGVAGGGGTNALGVNAPNIIGLSYISQGGGGGSGANSTTPQQAGKGSQTLVGSAGTVYVGPAAGGISGGTINGGTGTSITYPQHGLILGGGGGGGGGGQSTVGGAVAGNGGNGGTPGGSGGGGGGSIDGVTSGAGGNGARGELWIIEYF
jgi:hypothetical protein